MIHVVEDDAENVLATFHTQHEAMDWARQAGHVTLLPSRSVFNI